MEMITDEELAQRIEIVRKSCYSAFAHSTMHRDRALNNIIKILRDTTRTQLQAYEPNIIIMCTIKILFYYDESLSVVDNICEWKRRRKTRIARDCYYNLLKIYIPERSQEVIEAVIDTLHEDRLWEFEIFCFEVICDLLEYGANGAITIHIMWNKIESPSINIQDTRMIIRILYEVLDIYIWPETQDTVTIVERMLKFFYVSIINLQSSNESYATLKKGLEVCIRNTVKNLSNDHLLIAIQHMCSWATEEDMTENIILDFGSTLEYTAYMHQTALYENTLTPKIFPLIMQMIASSNRIISLLGNRVMQYLIDRKDNRLNFNTPKIFFEDTQWDLRVGQCHKEDKIFLKIHREVLHDSLLKSILNHSMSRINLETTYCTICLIAVEVPCGFTAAALVCLTMNLQDLTLEQNNDHKETTYHIHAIVIAVMSLICWIHKAKVFYSYINKIMIERAQWAPHLNPPIQSQYSFAVHHISWNKPELFFVDWEARYGLWKCFRLRENEDITTSIDRG